MATALFFAYHFFASLLLLCLLLAALEKCYVVEGIKTTENSLLYHTVNVNSFLATQQECNRSSRVLNKRPSSLEVVNKFGPCYQLHSDDGTSTRSSSPSSPIEILLHDQYRVDSIHARLSLNSGRGAFQEMKQTTLPMQSGLDLGSGNYVVKVGLGTPKKDFSLVFDTGSDITWTQCEPCVGSCYQQAEPKFDPRKSTSYKNASCSSSSCSLITQAGGARGCSSSTCLYRIQYGDGSYSIGFLATDKLTITSADVFANFIFGCGQKNAGSMGRVAGLLGLGRSPLSFSSQSNAKYKKLFSYCMPSSSDSTGFLAFAPKIPKSTKFTPLSADFQDTPFYGVDVVGLGVGGTRLAIDAVVFSSGGTVIDSGTVITRMPPTAYSALRSAFREQMRQYPLTNGVSILDTCYDLSGYSSVLVPKVSVVFKGGVEVLIDVSGILFAVNGAEQVCLAFAANDDDGDLGIFGNTQQKTYEVVYDGAEGRVGFAAKGCT